MLFQSIDQPFHPLAEARDGTIKGPSPVFVLLARHGDADAVAPEVLADRAAAGGLVAHEATMAVFGTTAPTPLDGSACHQGFERHGLVALPRGQHQRHPLAPAFRADMDLRAEAALTAAECFGLRAPCAYPSGMLVRPDHGAIHTVDIPGELLRGVRALLNRRKEASPNASLAPAGEAAGDGIPVAIALGQVAPGSACADNPQDAIQDASVVSGWAACVRFVRGKQGL